MISSYSRLPLFIQVGFVLFLLALGVVISIQPLLTLGFLFIGIAIIGLSAPRKLLQLLLFVGGISVNVLVGEDVILLQELGGFQVSGLLLGIMVPLLGFITLVKFMKLDNKIKVPSALRIYVLFVTFAAISLLYTTDLNSGIRLLFKLLYPFLVALVTVLIIQSREERLRLEKYLIAGGLLVSVLGLLNFTGRGEAELYLRGGAFRYTSGFAHPSVFSFYMLALFALVYIKWRYNQGRGYLWLAIIFGAQIFLSMTRIGLISFLLIVFLTEFLRQPNLARRLFTSFLLAVLLIGASIYSLMEFEPLQSRFFYRPLSDRSLEEYLEYINDQGRRQIWSAAFNQYLQGNLIFGQGLGSSTGFLRSSGFEKAGVMHNEYLRLLYETGIVGLTLFLFVNLILMGNLIKLIKASANGDVRVTAVVAFTTLVIYMVVAITDNPLDYYMMFAQYVFAYVGLSYSLTRETKDLTSLSLSGA
jgi:O-antigen ligase